MKSRAAAQEFRKTVWKHYKAHGRHDLPWRKTHDPYRILVSDVMLQQTQVERVTAFYREWLVRFPNVHALAKAPLSEVLTAWQGLGYNRRAKMLHDAAKVVSKEYNGKFPETPEALEALPGIGPYTARAVAAFAHNQDVVFVETNLRTAVLHHFFPRKKKVADAEIIRVLADAYPKGRAREWYAALMDYGAHLKRSGVRLNAKAKSYAKQTRFAGSAREARGAILKCLVRGPKAARFLVGILGDDREIQVKSQLASLTKEGLIELRKGKFQLPG